MFRDRSRIYNTLKTHIKIRIQIVESVKTSDSTRLLWLKNNEQPAMIFTDSKSLTDALTSDWVNRLDPLRVQHSTIGRRILPPRGGQRTTDPETVKWIQFSLSLVEQDASRGIITTAFGFFDSSCRESLTAVCKVQTETQWNPDLSMDGDVEKNPVPANKYPCGLCKQEVRYSRSCYSTQCAKCGTRWHQKCSNLTNQNIRHLIKSRTNWYCHNCNIAIKAVNHPTPMQHKRNQMMLLSSYHIIHTNMLWHPQ